MPTLIAILCVVALVVVLFFWIRDRMVMAAKHKLYGDARTYLAKAESELLAASNRARAIESDAAVKAKLWRDQANDDVKAAQSKLEQISHRYTSTVGALDAVTRKLDGYGDAFVVPTHSILDDLAEDFSHTDGGARLKAARAFTRSLAKSGQAAVCTVTDQATATITKRFITDAFNGKVDSILSESKLQNYGTLRQQIKDAYAEVNYAADAFYAKITDAYLDARLDELKWAVVANEAKIAEREEQRAIREKLREEEKARREYEKAIAEAEKEEATIRKAMEKAQREIEKASAEQRVAFEAQLAELQGKLAAAEAKNQRALSMAQQTKAGHVYVISNVGSFGEDVFKVGMTRRLEPQERIDELGDASVPFEFDVHAIVYSEDAPGLENALHKELAAHRLNKVNLRKEFFRASPARLRELITARSPNAHFTLSAEAKEYRESIALGSAS